jgi:hypothetical protein
MYFTNFPISSYSVSDKNSVLVTDFIKAIRLDPIIKDDAIFSDPYSVRDNETPEVISHKVYGSVQYHWVIMLLNERFDPYNDFPKSDDIIRQQTIKKFGSLNDIHHYEDADGNIICILPGFVNPVVVPVTNYEYMTKLNEEKRSIRILKQEILPEFVQRFKETLKS